MGTRQRKAHQTVWAQGQLRQDSNRGHKGPSPPLLCQEVISAQIRDFLVFVPTHPTYQSCSLYRCNVYKGEGCGETGPCVCFPTQQPQGKVHSGLQGLFLPVLIPGKVGKVITHGNHSFILAFLHDAPTPPLWLPGSRASLPKALPVLGEHLGQGPDHRVQPPASDFPDGSSANLSSRVFMNDAQIV